MLDNTVAGGIGDGASAWETLLKEAHEEASLPESLLTTHAKPAGAVSYYYIRDARAGGETGFHQPEVQYVYDLEVGEDVVPAPNDDEVQEFKLWDVEKVCFPRGWMGAWMGRWVGRWMDGEMERWGLTGVNRSRRSWRRVTLSPTAP